MAGEQPEHGKVGTRIKLSALWVTLMLLYVYADIFSFYEPGELQEALDGMLGPYPVTQRALLIASALMVVPALMVFLTLVLPAAFCRWANILLGAFYTMVNVTNPIGETFVYYWIFGGIEAVLTLAIVVYALRWRVS